VLLERASIHTIVPVTHMNKSSAHFKPFPPGFLIGIVTINLREVFYCTNYFNYTITVEVYELL